MHAQINNNPQKHVLYSHILGEYRNIQVSIPPGYDKLKKSYPVLYILDGEWIFEYARGCVDYLGNEELGKIPQMLVVGIENTNRKRDLSVTFATDAPYHNFLDFLEFELKAFVEKNYRVNGFDLIYGWSSASAICSQFLATRPEVFDAYIESGSDLEWQEEHFLKKHISQNTYQHASHYVSTESKSSIRMEGVRRYALLMDDLKPRGLRSRFEVLSNHTHLDVLSQGLAAGLRFTFEPYLIPDSVMLKGKSAMLAYLDRIDPLYKFSVEIPEGILHTAVNLLCKHGNYTEAIQILLYGMDVHTLSPHIPAKLAALYEDLGERDKALTFYLLARHKAEGNAILFQKYNALYESLLEDTLRN